MRRDRSVWLRRRGISDELFVGCGARPAAPGVVKARPVGLGAARSIKDKPGVHTFDDFVILNGPYRRYIIKLIARELWAKAATMTKE